MRFNYFPTHCHTDFSSIKFPDSINKIDELIDRAYEMKLPGIAITDHDCTSAYVRAEKHIKKRRTENPTDERWKNFKLVLGNEIYLCRNGLNKDNYDKENDKYFHFILLAKDEIGNQQIREISTRAWTRSYMFFHRRVPTYWSDLEEIIGKDPGHVIAQSACLGGQLPYLIIKQRDDNVNEARYEKAILRWIAKVQSIFGRENFFLELQPNNQEDQIYVNKKLIHLSKELNIPAVVSTDVHYLKKEDRIIHRAYLKSKQAEREVDDFYETTYLMSADEIYDHLTKYLEDKDIQELFINTLKILDKCEEYSILKQLELPYIPKKRFDEELVSDFNISEVDFPYFSRFFNSEQPSDRQFAIRLFNFIMNEKTVGDKENLLKTLEHELEIIWNSSVKMNVHWSKYFLQVADYIKIIWEDGDSIVAASRGSAGASYVMYALDIIQIDRTREKAPLVFERFLNPDRASVLDVDIDIESTKRNYVIDALQKEYGEDHVVRVSTFRTEKAKSAILAAARGVGISIEDARYIASLIKSDRGIQYSLSETYYGDEEKQIKPNLQFREEMNKYPKLWTVAKKIEGLVSGIGIHAGGLVITEDKVQEHCSIMATTDGTLVTSLDLEDAEEVSLIKINTL